MSVPVKPLFALGVAFAAGVGVTAAYVGAKPERAVTHEGQTSGILDGVAASNAAKEPSPRRSTNSSAMAVPDAMPATNEWVDPVKQRSVAAPPRQPLPALVFSLNEKPERAPDRASSATEQKGLREVDQPIVAQAIPPRRPEASELAAPKKGNPPPFVAPSAIDRTLLVRRVVGSMPHRTDTASGAIKSGRNTSIERTASLKEDRDGVEPSSPRQIQRLDVIRDGQTDVPQHYYPSGRNRYVDFRQRALQVDRQGYRQASTSQPSSGVMRWLNQ